MTATKIRLNQVQGFDSTPSSDADGKALVWSQSLGKFSFMVVPPKGDTGEKGDKGDTGDQGIQGLTGPKGDPGTGIQLKGTVATSGALPSSGNAAGDTYLVTGSGHLWMWSGSAWADLGLFTLTYTPQQQSAQLDAIGAFTTETGLLKKIGASTWTFDTNTYITGNQGITLSGDVTGTGTTAITATLANSGVTAGTYKSVTVNAKGLVTGGTNPTTLAGFGITDGLTSATAASTYQTISGMSSYLTTASAASTYETSTHATATYQTIGGMSSYLTASAAAAAYAPLASPSFVGSATTKALTTKNICELATLTASAPPSTANYDVCSQSLQFYTTNASANWTVNLRGSSTKTMDSLLSTADAISVTLLAKQGGTAYYNTAVQVDGTTSGVTTYWINGAPTQGNTNAVDIYTYTIFKTGSATFTVIASQAKAS